MSNSGVNLARMRYVVAFFFAATFWSTAHGYTSIIPNKAWYSDIECSSRYETTIWGEADKGWVGVADAVIDHLNSHDCHVKANGVDVVNHFFKDECKVNPSTPGAGKLGKVTCSGHIFHECLRNCTSWTTPNWGFSIWKDCGEGNVFDSADEQCHCYSRKTKLYFPPEGVCVAYADRYHAPETCPRVGNPILPSSGVKLQFETGTQLAGAGLSLAYNSRSILPMPGSEYMGIWEPKPFGELWGSSLHKRLKRLVGTRGAVVAERGSTVIETFEYAGDSGYYPTYKATRPQAGLALTKISTGYRLVDSLQSVIEVYDANTSPDANATFDRIDSASFADGRKLTHQYSAGVVAGVSPEVGLLIAVTDAFGHQTRLFYERPTGIPTSRVYKIIGPDDQQILLGYDGSNNLSSLTWPDGKVKTYLHEIPELPGALTGVVDEDDKRYGTYGYDSAGRATSTEHGNGFNRHVATWSVPPGWNIVETYDEAAHVLWRDHYWSLPQGLAITDPLNQFSALEVALVNGEPRLKSRSQPGGSGCEASSNRMEYDSRGNIKLRVDFSGRAACYAHDSTRSVETVRIEGWPAAEAERCLTEDLTSYQVPDQQPPNAPQRKITTKWHPLWKLETRRAEPKRITTTVYNGEKDPLNGDQVLTCIVDGDPRLPDGITRLAVVCKRYEQATADESGNLGFNAPEIDRRSWSYTYNSYGQIKTEIGPRGQQSYEYWPAPTAFTGDVGHWQGDLSKVTNALGQDTLYLEYNKRGQVLKIQHPNGSIEQREYWPRGWLKSVTLTPAGSGTPEVTEYTYYATGLLKKATQPDGSWTFYTWDAAHRLVNVRDSADNTVDYVLDDLGNRKSETYKGPQDALAKTITRTFDALGRMDSSKGSQ
jgi:YD repeat-containing protein